MELKQLEQFKAVADCNHLSKAAEQLYITQPALSKSIAKLEQEAGFELFRHEKNKISLNRSGEAFLRYAERVLAAYDELQRFCADQRGRDRPVRLISSNAMAFRYVEPIVRMRLPELKIAYDIVPEEEMYQRLLDGQADAVLTPKRTVNTELNVLPLYDEYATFLVPPGHRLYEKTMLELTDLDGEKIIFAKSDFEEMDWVRRRYLDYGVRIEPTYVEDYIYYNTTVFYPDLLVASSTIAEQFWPPLHGCRSLRMAQNINSLTQYTFYFVFTAENRGMGELYLRMKPLLQM